MEVAVRGSQGLLSIAARRTRYPADYVIARRAGCTSGARRLAHGRATASNAEASTSSATSSPVQPVASSSAASGVVSGSISSRNGADVVRAFYEAYNRRDLATISSLIAEDISYHDLVYPEPHEGRDGVLAWLGKVMRYAPDDLLFVIEDITEGDPVKVGVKWHVEVGDGVFFPFSRGCSFITLDPVSGQISSVRDVVEPSSKPGDSTLQLLGLLAPLMRSLGPERTSPEALARLPVESAALWAFYAAYFGVVMLSTWVPGPPAVATPPEVLTETFWESVNLFWINDALTQLHLSFIPAVPSPPVSEALFNFVIAWAALFAPLVWTDAKCEKIGNKAAWFGGMMFLTNVFFIPFMALRAAPEPLPATSTSASTATSTSSNSSSGASNSSTTSNSGASSSGASGSRKKARLPAPGSQALPGWSVPLGVFGGAMGLFALGWAALGRPEMGGDLAARAAYFQDQFNGNRVFWAFILDMGIFYAWQLSFMEAAPAKFKYVPMFGMAAFLASGGSRKSSKTTESS